MFEVFRDVLLQIQISWDVTFFRLYKVKSKNHSLTQQKYIGVQIQRLH
jgi:hypothetical protein